MTKGSCSSGLRRNPPLNRFLEPALSVCSITGQPRGSRPRERSPGPERDVGHLLLHRQRRIVYPSEPSEPGRPSLYVARKALSLAHSHFMRAREILRSPSPSEKWCGSPPYRGCGHAYKAPRHSRFSNCRFSLGPISTHVSERAGE